MKKIMCQTLEIKGFPISILIGENGIGKTKSAMSKAGVLQCIEQTYKRVCNNEVAKQKFLELLSDYNHEIDAIIENGISMYELRKTAYAIGHSCKSFFDVLSRCCDPNPTNVIYLEEPENGLHPDLIQVISKAIRYASERTQVIATTHSISLVDYFTDMPESIVICEKTDCSTEFRRLDPEEMAPCLEEYRLGDLWSSGEIGGNRW